MRKLVPTIAVSLLAIAPLGAQAMLMDEFENLRRTNPMLLEIILEARVDSMEWVNLFQLARDQKQLFCIPNEPPLVGANYVLLVSQQARVDRSTKQVGELLLRKLISLYPCK